MECRHANSLGGGGLVSLSKMNKVQSTKGQRGSYSIMTAAVWALVPLLSILSTINAGEVKPVIASQIRGLDPARKCASIAKGGVTPSSLAVIRND